MAEEQTAKARPGRIWRTVLVLSLALNLAVLGVVVGSVASGRVGDGPPRSFDLGIGPVSRALEPEERREIGRNLRRDGSMRSADLRNSVNGIVTALKAEPYDPEVLRILMDAQAASMMDIQARAQAATLEQISAMTPQRRRAFADQLEEELSRIKPRRTRRSGD
jgi:uncharacterized membrane protein